MATHNLNLLEIPVASNTHSEYKRVPAVAVRHNEQERPVDYTFVYFDHIEQVLLDYIHKSSVVFGCVAWMTNFEILQHLSFVKAVQIVVQKEDFLRPDTGKDYTGWKQHLRAAYDDLKCPISHHELDGVANELSTGVPGYMNPVRCVGNHNGDKKPAFPRMHHKFLIFGQMSEGPGYIAPDDPFDVSKPPLRDRILASYDDGSHMAQGVWIEPQFVWTGSFNLTENATHSFENAVVMSHPDIVRAYYREYMHIYSLSEPLDWTSEWVAPEFRIGT
jgi:hypothetical protein